MSQRVEPGDLINYSNDQIICSESEPRKKLIYRTIAEKPKAGNNINFRSFFVVLDKFDHEISVSDFLVVALKVYNNTSSKNYHHLINKGEK